MSDNQGKYLDTFPSWLRTLGEDAEAVANLVELEMLPEVVRETLTGGVNYLFKSLDLIPDGIDDIGYLDDAFVLRVATDLAAREDISALTVDQMKVVSRLSEDCELLQEFLDTDYERLEVYVKGLRRGAARGRAVADIVSDQDIRSQFLSDVRAFAKSYSAPEFGREEKNLIKLKAFFDAKLPK